MGCLLVSACAFKPLYMQKNELLKQTASVHVEPVIGDGSYQMGLIVSTKLNPQHIQVPTKYRLNIQIEKAETSNESIRTDNFATLEKMSLEIKYQLVDSVHNKEVLSSSVKANGMHSLIDQPYATEVAKDKLHQDLVNTLADDIVLHIFSYFEELESES